MKRYTLKLDNNNVVGWYESSIPRGRVIGYSISGVYLHGAVAASFYMNFYAAQVVDSHISYVSTDPDRTLCNIDEESNGKLYWYLAADGKITPVVTLFYADETTEFQIQV